MKYIFVTGAPGSKFSSVCRNFYFSSDIDHSDFIPEYMSFKTIHGEKQLMHLGAYFDPQPYINIDFDRFSEYSKAELEAEFDRFFSGDGIRIIKGHAFCHHLDFIRGTWPDCPIVLADRHDDACLGWWMLCGNFNIDYPKFTRWKSFEEVGFNIKKQNKDLRDFVQKSKTTQVYDNIELCTKIGIKLPPRTEYDKIYIHNYAANDIKIYLSY